MAPEVIGTRYRVKTAIGHGGMGTVWLCNDELLGRDVAVKQVGLLPGESATDSARALREARSTATLNHRNVVSVFDIVEEGGSIWMVMEYVPSRTLAEIVRDDGPLPPERVAAIGAQVAEGLAAAHAAGVIHRDVKPANVLVTRDGVAKIGDFGIARSVGDEPLTQAGLVTGTPSYFSPELAQGHEPGPGSDVWALGATLYTAVEGRPPYPPQQNPVAMLRTIATEPPARPQRAGFLASALTRMLDRDPGSRWSMPDAAHTLHRLAERHRTDGTRQDTAEFAAPPAADRPSPGPRAAGPAGPVGPVEPVAEPSAESPAPTADSAAPPAESASPPTESPAPPAETGRPVGDTQRRRRFPLLPVAAAVLLLLVAAGLGYRLLSADGNPPDPGPKAAGPTHAASPSHSPSRKPSSNSAAPSTAASSPAQRPTSAAAAQVAFIRDYYRTAPRNQDAGWSRLGPHEKQVGRSDYDRFWGSIDSVDVHRVTPHPGDSTADVTLTYHFSSGKVVTEQQRLDLLRSGGGYLIDDDRVVSSRTVRD